LKINLPTPSRHPCSGKVKIALYILQLNNSRYRIADTTCLELYFILHGQLILWIWSSDPLSRALANRSSTYILFLFHPPSLSHSPLACTSYINKYIKFIKSEQIIPDALKFSRVDHSCARNR
jgi:hypothetical protein